MAPQSNFRISSGQGGNLSQNNRSCAECAGSRSLLYLMDETSFLKKRAMVEVIQDMPKNVFNAIGRISTVRNALAHSFFPQNRRRYWGDKKVTYNGKLLFTLEGIEKFQQDYDLAYDWLEKKVWSR